MISVLGAGPHGKQIAEMLGTPALFDDDIEAYPTLEQCEGEYIAGALWPLVRRRIAERAVNCVPWQHGIVVFPGVQIGQNVTLGDHNHILYNAVISHGCTLWDFVTVCSGAVLAGEVTVGDDVFIGANATIIHGGITIGDGATIGAGAVVLANVPPGATVVGSPARVLAVSV